MRKNFEQAYTNIALRRLSSISKKLSDDFQALRDAHEADTKELEAENAALREHVPKVVKPEQDIDYPMSFWCDCDFELCDDNKFCPECGAKLDWSEVAP